MILSSYKNNLRSLIKRYSNREILVIIPGGNFGDQLIYCGANKLFQNLNISFQSLTCSEFLEIRSPIDKPIYIHGGGGFNSYTTGNSFKILKHAIEISNANIIQGPATVDITQDVKDFFVNLHQHPKIKNLTFTVRERTSYNFLKNTFHEKRLLLCVDTALFLNKEDLYNIIGESERYKRTYNLLGMRIDTEKKEFKQLNLYGYICLDPARFSSSFKNWLLLHSRAKKIITNRTHSGILSAILGKEVVLLPGSYHKNKSIWEHSLKSFNVIWAEELTEITYPFYSELSLSYLLFIILLPFFKFSWKLNKFCHWLAGVPIK